MTDRTTDGTGGPGRDTRIRRRRRTPGDGPPAGARAAGAVATVISAVTTIVVAILAVHIVFVVFEANTGNDIVAWFAARAGDLAWRFEDVFRPDDAKTAVAINYGLAAAVYLAAGRVIAALVRRAV
ncbi:hypothetical protein [Actinomadura sp. WMMB 499]|uniref:hypothetical protein n=1 Tax=Actinomadura sp. WMMB 499 TaxID=1219491 RepID=UPI00124777A8|nr:hypothetical protein [Actinomadura sp. WMMB 499]QFG21923.1 hypothetical protein F7P10_13095 [Actinomadura sp. WMMB 499]